MRDYRLLFLLAIALLMPAAAGAQSVRTPSPNPVTDAARGHLARFAKFLVASGDLLPADKYGFQPTPAQMTFAALVAHIVQTNIALCHGASGAPSPMTPQEMKAVSAADGKTALAAALRKSFEYCEQALAAMQDSVLSEEAVIFGQPAKMTRAAALLTIVVDWADHYSTAASYLRLNGLLPPSATPTK